MRQRHPALGAIFALFSFGDFRSSFSFFGPSQVSVQSLNIQWPRQPRETRSSFFCSWESLALEVWSSTSAGSPATIGRSTPGFTGTGSTHTCVAVAETSASYPPKVVGKPTAVRDPKLRGSRRNQSQGHIGRYWPKTHTEPSGPLMSQAHSEARGSFFAQPHFGALESILARQRIEACGATLTLMHGGAFGPRNAQLHNGDCGPLFAQP
jgi:hypothetical protein